MINKSRLEKLVKSLLEKGLTIAIWEEECPTCRQPIYGLVVIGHEGVMYLPHRNAAKFAAICRYVDAAFIQRAVKDGAFASEVRSFLKVNFRSDPPVLILTVLSKTIVREFHKGVSDLDQS